MTNGLSPSKTKGKEVKFGGIAGFQQRISGREYKPCS